METTPSADDMRRNIADFRVECELLRTRDLVLATDGEPWRPRWLYLLWCKAIDRRPARSKAELDAVIEQWREWSRNDPDRVALLR